LFAFQQALRLTGNTKLQLDGPVMESFVNPWKQWTNIKTEWRKCPSLEIASVLLVVADNSVDSFVVFYSLGKSAAYVI
jgi:hypothetical protein